MDSAEKIYNIFSSITSVVGGLLLIFPKSRDFFIKSSIRISMWWYKKTHLSIFKSQAERIGSDYSIIMIIIIAILFVYTGISTFLQNI